MKQQIKIMKFSSTNNGTDDYDDKQQIILHPHTFHVVVAFLSYKTCFLFANSFVFLPIKCVIVDCMSG